MTTIAYGTTIGLAAVGNDGRLRGVTPELAAYVRTELGGDVSRIRAAPRRAAERGLGTRLRYWLNSFRGYAVLDVRGEQV